MAACPPDGQLAQAVPISAWDQHGPCGLSDLLAPWALTVSLAWQATKVPLGSGLPHLFSHVCSSMASSREVRAPANPTRLAFHLGHDLAVCSRGGMAIVVQLDGSASMWQQPWVEWSGEGTAPWALPAFQP